jgi:hypothetical protein
MMYIKEQITTTEVNIARVYNYNVKVKEDEKRKAVAAGPKPTTIPANN